MTVDALTILLTLKDRTPFTFRWLSYHNSIRFPFRVFIADGGADDRVQAALATADSFPHLDYEYVRYPYDTTYSDFHAKVADALARIPTPFVALADNDDVFVVNGLRKAVQFLIDHQDYATCGGQSAAFWIRPPQSGDRAGVLYGPHVDWKCSLEDGSLTDDTASARVRKLSRMVSHPGYYHVRRTEDVRRQFAILRDADPRDPFLSERLIFFLSAIAGKTRQLDTLYIARQWNSPDSAGGAYQATHGDWFGRMLAPSWSRDFTRFADATAVALAAQDGITVTDARRAVIDSYRLWVAPQLLAELLTEPTVTMPMFLGVRMFRQLLRLPPDNLLRRAARALYRRAPWVSVDAIHGTQWRTRRVSNAEQAFKPLQEFLANNSTEGWPPGSLKASETLS